MKTKTKILIGLFTIVTVVTIASVVTYTLASDGLNEGTDPHDPGNSPGPGNWMGEQVTGSGQLLLEPPTTPITNQYSFC